MAMAGKSSHKMSLYLLSLSLCVLIIVMSDHQIMCDDHQKGKCWEYWCRGDCSLESGNAHHDLQTKPGLVLMGGGTDVDEAFQWMIDYSDNGHFLVLRASGDDAYNDYIYHLGRSKSVSTLKVTCRNSSDDEFVLDIVSRSHAIFFAGGDQYMYSQYWNQTKLFDLIISDLRHRIPIGGTSAGCDIQGQYIYDAQNGSVLSKEALLDPYDSRVTISRGMFKDYPSLHNRTIITDTHFFQRDRMGRVVTFLGRIMKDFHEHVIHGIAVNEGTALLIDSESGKARIVHQTRDIRDATVYFLTATWDSSHMVCEPGQPLSISHVKVYKAKPNGKDDCFDFNKWEGYGGETYELQAEDGYLRSSSGDIY